jgi:hypothetical protein
MPERRMFAKTIIDSDAFLDMPISAQLLYFHLSMRADDDGFVNKPKSIMRVCGCKDDDIQILFAKKFVIPFESGIVVIKHWKIHNYIRKDTYTETKYKEEKALLETDENGSYRINYLEPVTISSRTCNETLTQDRLGKDRLGKDSIDSEQKRTRFVPTTLEEVKDYCSERKNNVDAERFFDYYSANGWVQGKNKPIKDWKACVRTWEKNDKGSPAVKPQKDDPYSFFV